MLLIRKMFRIDVVHVYVYILIQKKPCITERAFDKYWAWKCNWLIANLSKKNIITNCQQNQSFRDKICHQLSSNVRILDVYMENITNCINNLIVFLYITNYLRKTLLNQLISDIKYFIALFLLLVCIYKSYVEE